VRKPKKLARKFGVKMRKISKKGLKKKCWKLMSLWVRLKNADKNGYVRCITCDKIKHFRQMDCGHLRHGVLDYYEKNLAPQCDFCNRFNSGQRDLFYRWAIKTYGQKEVDKLYQKANEAKKGELYTIEELQKIAVVLTLKINLLPNNYLIKDKIKPMSFPL